jgi:hypothetical protein
MILTGSPLQFETQFASTSYVSALGNACVPRAGERVLAIANFSWLRRRKPSVEKSVFRRDAESRSPWRPLPQEFYFASSRNQRSAIEVCASLASCPPWNVPILIR